jgi:hypothetical protein
MRGDNPKNICEGETPRSCKAISTLEILDTVSGRTLVTLGHVETIPSIIAVTLQLK